MSQKSMRSMAIVLLAALVVGGTCLMILDVAGAKPAKASALTDTDITIVGDENGGDYTWDNMKDPWEKDADAIIVQSGQARIFFVYPPQSGSHDATLRKSQSTPGVTFPMPHLIQNTGETDIRWPSGGWKPVKSGTYALYCSKHYAAMKMRVIVKGFATKLSPETKRGIVKRGSKAIYAKVTAGSPVKATVRVVQCKNSSCSKGSAAYAKAISLRKGSNRLRLGFRSGLGAGRYQVEVVTPAETLRSAFTVKR